MKVQKILNISMSGNELPRPVKVVATNSAIQLILRYVDFTIPDGTTATLYARKPSGKFVYQTTGITISGNVVTVNLENQVIMEDGIVPFQVELKNGTDTLTTFSNHFLVDRNYKNSDAEKSKTVITEFEKLLQKAQTASGVGYDDSETKLGADNVQAAIGKLTGQKVDKDNISLGIGEDGLVYLFIDGNPVGDGMDISGGEVVRYGKIIVSLEELSIAEGGSKTFDVTLSRAPSEAQTVYLTSADNLLLSVEPATLTFTKDNWDVPQTVTVIVSQDENMIDEETYVSLTSKANEKIIFVAITDDDKIENPFTNHLASLIYYENVDISGSDYSFYDTATQETVQSYQNQISAFKHIASNLAMTPTLAYNKVDESSEFTLMTVIDATRAPQGGKTAIMQNSGLYQYGNPSGKIENEWSGSSWDNFVVNSTMPYINTSGTKTSLSINANVSYVINNLSMLSENWLYTMTAKSFRPDGKIDFYVGSDLIYTTEAPEDFVSWAINDALAVWSTWKTKVVDYIDHWAVIDRAVTGDEIRNYYKFLASSHNVTSF